MTQPLFREAVIDRAAITRNVEHLRALVGTPHTMAVVKANGYGHGAVESARAALAGGADWLGVADIREGVALREAGVTAPVLAWLHEPEADFGEAVRAGIDVGVSSRAQLEQLAAAGSTAAPASVQIKFETGLSRNGVAPAEWDVVLADAVRFQNDGTIRVTGLFSHLSNASPADDAAAIALFSEAVARAAAVGIAPELVHLAATAAALRLPAARFTMVRLGVGIYGLSPFDDTDAAELGLTPAMTVRGRVAAVRRVPAGTGVSYDYAYRTERETGLALVPLGYAEGVPRQASGRAEVSIGGRRYPVCGRIAMDQFVVEVGDDPVEVGDEVVLFGDPATGAPGATDWAVAASTINYEIVTRIGPRVHRSYV
ncbi:alanine racemase [Compostimonas suwonensis]|uniref:Alanine racemase n=1 Tax=Compostimonas suwonensis TaxID=1048394 RepID=A0A2M9BV71_9MICO|nr:alanine racemase [Compostimonas suwonensis]PJJ61842.1 alanine racemase [Compostimonas suwonensis]